LISRPNPSLAAPLSKKGDFPFQNDFAPKIRLPTSRSCAEAARVIHSVNDSKTAMAKTGVSLTSSNKRLASHQEGRPNEFHYGISTGATGGDISRAQLA
jgi:hypothetical protein